MAALSDLVNVQININTASFAANNYSQMAIVNDAAVAANPRAALVVSVADAQAQLNILATDPLYGALSDAFAQAPTQSQILVIARYTTDATLGAALDAGLLAASALVTNGGFYGFTLASGTIADKTAAMVWAQANQRLFLFMTSEPDALVPTATDDLLSLCKTNNYTYCAGIYHALATVPTPSDWPDAALMAKCFAYPPGSENWSNQELNGVLADTLNETQRASVLAKNGTTYQAYGNLACTFNGMVGSGQFIDVIRFKDWLLNQVQVQVGDVIVGSPKVPFTDSGISLIKHGMIAALEQGVLAGGISEAYIDPGTGALVPSYTVSVPARADILPSQVSTRKLIQLAFSAQLAGAIDNAAITGTLSYSKVS